MQEIRPTVHKWDLIKFKRFCIAKEIIREVKRKSTEWDETFIADTSDRAVVPEYINYSKHKEENN